MTTGKWRFVLVGNLFNVGQENVSSLERCPISEVDLYTIGTSETVRGVLISEVSCSCCTSLWQNAKNLSFFPPQLNSVLWECAFGGDCHLTAEDVLCQYMERPSISPALQSKVPSPWDPSSLMSDVKLVEMLKQVDQISEHLG